MLPNISDRMSFCTKVHIQNISGFFCKFFPYLGNAMFTTTWLHYLGFGWLNNSFHNQFLNFSILPVWPNTDHKNRHCWTMWLWWSSLQYILLLSHYQIHKLFYHALCLRIIFLSISPRDYTIKCFKSFMTVRQKNHCSAWYDFIQRAQVSWWFTVNVSQVL